MSDIVFSQRLYQVIITGVTDTKFLAGIAK